MFSCLWVPLPYSVPPHFKWWSIRLHYLSSASRVCTQAVRSDTVTIKSNLCQTWLSYLVINRKIWFGKKVVKLHHSFLHHRKILTLWKKLPKSKQMQFFLHCCSLTSLVLLLYQWQVPPFLYRTHFFTWLAGQPGTWLRIWQNFVVPVQCTST